MRRLSSDRSRAAEPANVLRVSRLIASCDLHGGEKESATSNDSRMTKAHQGSIDTLNRVGILHRYLFSKEAFE